MPHDHYHWYCSLRFDGGTRLVVIDPFDRFVPSHTVPCFELPNAAIFTKFGLGRSTVAQNSLRSFIVKGVVVTTTAET
jgi:hypothetical protein